MAYCSGCHSLKYSRYTRVAQDLAIPEDQLEQFLVIPGESKSGYMLSTMSAADAIALVGLFDYATGTEVRVFPLYFLPVALVFLFV